jgi:hypothetical protein
MRTWRIFQLKRILLKLYDNALDKIHQHSGVHTLMCEAGTPNATEGRRSLLAFRSLAVNGVLLLFRL